MSCRSSVFSKSISLCEEQTGLECGLFARRYTILWKNGINPGKGKESTFKSKWSDDQIRAKLTELGFLGDNVSSNNTKNIKKKKNENTSKMSNEDIQHLKDLKKMSQEEGINKVMAEHKLDGFVAPTGSPAWSIDWLNGDNYHPSSSSPAAWAGYPNISVPMGDVQGLPVGLSFFGTAFCGLLLLAGIGIICFSPKILATLVVGWAP